MEIWKEIKGYEGLYEVSNLGNVRSLDRIKMRSDGLPKKIRGVVLNPEIKKDGYLRVPLKNINAKETHKYVHRLVAFAFLDIIPNKLQVNHKDGCKSNNNLDNLEWCTAKENIRHYFKNKTTIKKQQIHPVKKLITNKSRAIIQLSLTGEIIKKFDSIKSGMDSTGTSRYAIYKCCNGVTEKTKGYKWRYAS